MKRSAVLGIVVVLVALAGAAFYWKARGTKAATAPAPRASSDAGVAASAKPKAAEPAAAPPGDLALRLDDDPKGPLRLEGQVIDADEQPVGGVTVAIDSNPPREVKTEGDGAFVFDGLLARAYVVEAHKDDLHGGPVNVTLGAKTEPVTVRLVAGVTLELSAQDGESKKPVAGARVEARGIVSVEAVAGADGVARLRGLAGGWLTVKVQAQGYAPAFATFQLGRAPGSVEQQTVQLHRGVAVSGHVVDDAGKPVAGARVLPVSGARGLFSGAGEAHKDGVLTDAQGKWKIAAVAPGSWRFEASEPKHAPGQSAAVILAAGGAPPADVVITLPAAASVDGEVRSAAGQPVPFASVRVTAPGEGFDFDQARQASCDEAGHFHLDGLPRRKAYALATHESGSSEVTTLDLVGQPEQKNVVLVLSQDGAIAGTVVMPAGQPVAEAVVIATPELGEGADADTVTRWRLLGIVSDVADQAGAFRLSGLPKGAYRLRATRAGGSMQDPATWQRRTETAQTGATGVKLVVEDDAVMKGKIAFKDGKSPDVFTVATSVFGAPTPFSSKNGEFRLEHVAPGSRLLTVSGPGFTRKTTDPFEVKAGVETDVGTIVVDRGRTVRGKVLKADGSPAAGAEVYAGNRFFGSGDSLKGPNGSARSAFGRDTTADKDGNFELPGIGVKAIMVVAEDETGRSTTIPVPPGEADVNLTLNLATVGAVEGKVTSANQPVGGAVIVAQAQKAYRGQFTVKAGADGTFRFDRLAPDSYLVSAVRPQGMGALDMETQVAVVQSGQTAHVELELKKTDLALTVAMNGDDGKPVKSGLVFALDGAAQATNPIELEAALAVRGAGGFHQGLIAGGRPQRFANMVAGAFTVCVLPVEGDVRDQSEAEKALKDPDALPVTCKPVEVAASPNEQSVTITVKVAK